MGVGALVIRADANPQIGAGHVMRCLALAQAWQDRSGRVVFLMAQCTPAIRERLAQEDCDVISVKVQPGDLDDALTAAAVAREHSAEWLVLDGYAFDSEYQRGLSAHGQKTLYVDDVPKCDHYYTEIVLNPNLSSSELQYRGRHNAELLIGTQYCLLRREFNACLAQNRATLRRSRKLLVTLGGSIHQGLALRLLAALAKIAAEIDSVDYVVGATSADSEPLQAAAKGLRDKITFHRNVSDIATLMARADIAIAAAGLTCWELCCMGVPSLLIDVADNQTPEALALEKKQCARYLGSAGAVTGETITQEVLQLLSSEERRRSMSIHSRELVDGRGADRVLAAMLGSELRSIVCAQTQESAG